MKNGRLLVAALAASVLLLDARIAPAAERPGPSDAILLLDGAPSDAEADRILRALEGVLGSHWTLVPASGLVDVARTDPVCSTGGEDPTPGLLASLREGARLFFEDTEIDRSVEVLTRAVDESLAHPCLLARTPDMRAATCGAGVLLVRLHLGSGRPEAAAALARRLSLVFSADEVGAIDVPPEAARFLHGIRADVESTMADLSIGVLPAGAASGATVILDGRPAGLCGVHRVAAGRHDVSVVLPGGKALSRSFVSGAGDLRVEFDIVLAGAIAPGPGGSLRTIRGAATAGDPESLGARLSEVTGRAVLLVRDLDEAIAGRGEARVILCEGGRTAPGDLLVLRANAGPGAPAGALEARADPDGPLAVRKPWPWPWIAGGAAAGFLVAGAVLNVTANQSARAINAGTNETARYRLLRGFSIASYSVAAAAAAGTLVVALLRPAPRTRFLVVPVATGAPSLGIAATF